MFILSPNPTRRGIPLTHIYLYSANNYCLKYVDASFYQIARGLVLPLTVVLSLVFLRSARPSLTVLLACGVVTLGFFVGVLLDSGYTAPTLPSTITPADAEKLTAKNKATTVSLLGIAFGLLSSLTTATHAIIIKRSLALVNGDAIQLAWYSNVLSSVVLLPVIFLVGEVPDALKLIETPLYIDGEMSVLSRFLWGSLVTGFVGWLLSIAGVLSIKITSPITHMVSSAVRGILQSAMGVWVFGDVITTGRGTSIAIILGGSMWYTWAKNEEHVAQRRREAEGNKLEMQEQREALFDAERQSEDLEQGHQYRNGEANGRRRDGRSYDGVSLHDVSTPDVSADEKPRA